MRHCESAEGGRGNPAVETRIAASPRNDAKKESQFEAKSMRILAVFIMIWLVSATIACGAVGEDFTIGAYYAMPQLQPTDNFGWDYAFMDLARNGCSRIVVSGNCWADGWAAIKHWGMKGLTSYGQLIEYPGPGNWDPSDLVAGIIVKRDLEDGFIWNSEYVGDAIIGHIMIDEPECHGLTEDEKDYLRAWADVYHQYNPTRSVWVNHCDPPWYDLNEKEASCSANATVVINGQRIVDRIQAAQAIGLENFTTVSLQGHLSAWAGGSCNAINYWNMDPCTQDVFDWLAGRTQYQDAYDMMIAAYFFGSKGYQPWQYNQHYAVSFVDIDGNDQYGIRAAFNDAAHDIRRAHGWPSVQLLNNGVPFNDRGNYPAGQFTLTEQATSDSGAIEKVIFGKSTNGGSDWQSVEDTTAPYSADFSTSAGETVIFRAQAVDTNGKKSIYAANMVYIN